MCFREDHLKLIIVALLQLPLQIPTAVLILAKAIDLITVILDGVVIKARKLGRISVCMSAGRYRLRLALHKAVIPIPVIGIRRERG
jgi:hypothetical protein